MPNSQYSEQVSFHPGAHTNSQKKDFGIKFCSWSRQLTITSQGTKGPPYRDSNFFGNASSLVDTFSIPIGEEVDGRISISPAPNFGHSGPVCLSRYDTTILVTGHKYPKMEGDHLHGCTDRHGCFAIYFFNPCFRVLIVWDKDIVPRLGPPTAAASPRKP